MTQASFKGKAIQLQHDDLQRLRVINFRYCRAWFKKVQMKHDAIYQKVISYFPNGHLSLEQFRPLHAGAQGNVEHFRLTTETSYPSINGNFMRRHYHNASCT